MPTFRTAPSQSLTTSIRNLVASGGSKLSPMGEIQADSAAARTARDLSLAEKVRLEVEQMREADARRRDPAYAQEYAGHVAGIDQPDSERLMAAISGKLEEPSAADYEDNPAVQPYPVQRPNLAPGQERQFRSALAATMANMLATGKTSADQLAHAGDRINTEGLRTEAAYAPDVETGNQLVAAISGKPRQPYAAGPQGTVVNREQGTLDESSGLAQAARRLSGSRAALADARTNAVKTGRVATPVAPERLQRMIEMTAQAEYKIQKAAYDGLRSVEKKTTPAPSIDKIREAVSARYRSGAKVVPDMRSEIDDATAAIRAGKNKQLVADRFKQRTGLDLSTVADTESEDDSEE